jgi:hypothetical protein
MLMLMRISPEMMAPGYQDIGWYIDNHLALFPGVDSEEFLLQKEVDVD